MDCCIHLGIVFCAPYRVQGSIEWGIYFEFTKPKGQDFISNFRGNLCSCCLSYL